MILLLKPNFPDWIKRRIQLSKRTLLKQEVLEKFQLKTTQNRQWKELKPQDKILKTMFQWNRHLTTICMATKKAEETRK
jgi:hypothetical protein